MIYKIRWLWKQFTGTIITTFAVGIFRLMMTIDSKLTYLHNISIDTANDSHLTLIGSIMGLPRAILVTTAEKYFYFTRTLQHNSDRGFSGLGSAEERSVGGQLIDLHDPSYSTIRTRTPSVLFRTLLKATAASDAEIGSIVWIEDVCKAFTTSSTPSFSFRWYGYDTPINEVRTYQDIEVFLGDMDNYGSAALLVRSLLAMTINGYANPEFFADVNFTD